MSKPKNKTGLESPCRRSNIIYIGTPIYKRRGYGARSNVRALGARARRSFTGSNPVPGTAGAFSKRVGEVNG